MSETFTRVNPNMSDLGTISPEDAALLVYRKYGPEGMEALAYFMICMRPEADVVFPSGEAADRKEGVSCEYMRQFIESYLFAIAGR
jgi:hypothetical protein